MAREACFHQPLNIAQQTCADYATVLSTEHGVTNLCVYGCGLFLQGAVAAGMRVVVVPSLVESHEEFKAISQEEAAADGKGGEAHYCVVVWFRVWFWCVIQASAVEEAAGGKRGQAPCYCLPVSSSGWGC
jgi:hypothetical protein